MRQGWLDELKLAMREYERVRDDQRRIHADVDLNVLRGVRLVGMTTAGVASKQELVAAMCPKVPLPVLPLPTLRLPGSPAESSFQCPSVLCPLLCTHVAASNLPDLCIATRCLFCI